MLSLVYGKKIRGAALKRVIRGLCYRKYMDYTLDIVHFCIYNNFLVTNVCLKIPTEGESQHKVVALFLYSSERTVHLSILGKCIAKNLAKN